MRIIEYVTNENEILYDFNTIKNILGVNKSKLQREMNKVEDKEYIKYKNQFLFKERTLFLLMEQILFERLDKIETNENELSKD